MSGNRYGYLIVLRENGRIDAVNRSLPRGTQKAITYLCQCDCGTEKTCKGSDLSSGHVRSCGCMTGLMKREKVKTHGQSKSLIYKRWISMHKRCNPNAASLKSRKDYADRGIKVCPRWDDFTCFLEDMGQLPTLKHTIERIDNDGDYEPSNCKWALNEEQARNKTTSHKLEIDGVSRCITDWARLSQRSLAGIRYRMSRGMNPKDAVFGPRGINLQAQVD